MTRKLHRLPGRAFHPWPMAPGAALFTAQHQITNSIPASLSGRRGASVGTKSASAIGIAFWLTLIFYFCCPLLCRYFAQKRNVTNLSLRCSIELNFRAALRLQTARFHD